MWRPWAWLLVLGTVGAVTGPIEIYPGKGAAPSDLLAAAAALNGSGSNSSNSSWFVGNGTNGTFVEQLVLSNHTGSGRRANVSRYSRRPQAASERRLAVPQNGRRSIDLEVRSHPVIPHDLGHAGLAVLQ